VAERAMVTPTTVMSLAYLLPLESSSAEVFVSAVAFRPKPRSEGRNSNQINYFLAMYNPESFLSYLYGVIKKEIVSIQFSICIMF
jgi:hypothetical protein